MKKLALLAATPLVIACAHGADAGHAPAAAPAAQVSAETLAAGRAVFERNCTPCHRADAGGVIGPNLTDDAWIYGGTPDAVLASVTHGHVERGMPAWGTIIDAGEVAAVAAYVVSLRGSNPPDPKAPQGEPLR